MANRFNQIVKPYVVNPISVETFSKVPMAKAMAKAAGLSAAASMEFNYDVDKADLNAVQEIVSPIEQGKDDMVNRILEEGVSDDLVNDFVSLKRGYDYAEDQIGIAEKNKVAVDKWEQNLLKVHGNNIQYMDLVKDKEYSKWGGTFTKNEKGEFVTNDTGNLKTEAFDASLGPNYINIKDDFYNQLKGISKTLENEYPGGGRFTEVTDTDGQKRMAYVTTTGKRVYSNENKLVARAEMLMQDYSDTKTERGAFAEYVGVDDNKIKEIADLAVAASISEDTRGGEERKQILANGKGKDTGTKVNNTRPIPGITAYTSGGQLQASINKAKDTELLTGIGKFIENAKMGLASGGASHVYGAQAYVRDYEGMDKTSEELGELNKEYNEKVAVTEEQAKAARKEFDALATEMAYETSRNIKLGEETGMVNLNPGSQKFAEDLAAANSVEDEEDRYDAQMKVLSKHLNQATQIKFEGNVVANRASFIEDVRDPDWNINAHLKDVSADIGTSSVPVMSLDSKTLADEDDIDILQGAIRNFNSGGKLKKGDYTLVYAGSGDANPKMYTNPEGQLIKNVAFGDVVTLQKVNDDDGTTKNVEKFVIGPGLGVTSTDKYQSSQSDLEAQGEIGIGSMREIVYTYPGTEQKVRGAMETVAVPTIAVDIYGNKVWARPGKSVIYRDGENLPLIYNTDSFAYISMGGEVTSSPYKLANEAFLTNTLINIEKAKQLKEEEEEKK